MASLLFLSLSFALLQARVPTMDTLVGTGKKGYAGDGGKARAALLDQPFHCELDRSGKNLYVAEAGNHCIRKVDLVTGVIRTVAGSGKKGYSGDGGPAIKATFNEPYAVVADEQENLYIVDRLNAALRRVDGKTGIVTTIAGTGKPGFSGDGGPGVKAQLREPNDCCLDGKGGLLIADVADWRVRRLDLKTGIITTVAGIGPRKGPFDRTMIGDGGPANRATLVEARAVCVDNQGNIFVCERRGNAIRRINAQGTITSFAGTGAKGHADGPGAKATFNGPKAIRCDDKGNVFVVDTENHSIRRIDAKMGKVTTVAGGQKGAGGDGGPALQAGLDRPHGCVIAADGTIYIADSNNNRIRRVAPVTP